MITQGIEMLDLRTGCRMLRISMRSAHRHQANPNSDLPKFFHVGGRCFYERAAIERFLARKAAAAEAEAEARLRDYVSPLAAFTVPAAAILRSAFVT